MESQSSDKQKPAWIRLCSYLYLGTKKYATQLGFSVRNAIARHLGLVDITRDCPLFCATGAGSQTLRSKWTLLSIQQTLPLLAQLSRSPDRLSVQEFYERMGGEDELAEALAKGFRQYGSDKSTTHNYHFVYNAVLKDRSAVRNLLEIGLGTNNPRVLSNMGKNGLPGASLRAFRDFLPNANIFGADVDRNILFEEDRIKTFFVDQTQSDTLNDLAGELPEELDVIIDDGLHAPNANLATLAFALPKLGCGGWFIVEDISRFSVEVWEVVSTLLGGDEYESTIIDTRNAYMFVCRKRG